MIDFYINNQTLKFFTPLIAADTLNYLTAQFHFSENWDGYTRWAHFRNGQTVYDIALDENDCIESSAALNLTIGFWEIFVTGSREGSRLTSTTVILEVKESGLEDAPLHSIPQSVAEQIDSKASQALLLAQSVKSDADAGKYDGRSFAVRGFFQSEQELTSAISSPEAGSVYGVANGGSYDFFIWDELHSVWVNIGSIMGIKGETGAVFTPYIDSMGNLSWSNNGGLSNPQTRNITGPAGQRGESGPAGAGAYEKALDAGYSGTEETFYSALTLMPYHNARHLPGGADPLIIKEAAIENGAVTAQKLAASAKTKALSLTLSVSGWKNKQQSITASGVKADSNVIAAPEPASIKGYSEAEVMCISQGTDRLTFSCTELPGTALRVNVLVLV